MFSHFTRGINKYVLSVLLTWMIISGCNNSGKHPPDTQSGTIHISVDESFKPVMEAQIAVFEQTYRGTSVIAHYKTEADCFKDLFRDTANRMIIVTRDLTFDEDEYLKDSLHYYPKRNDIASDAIAIIVNIKSDDTLFSIKRLQQQLSGKIFRNQVVVFDGLNATSTVRFAIDSILRGGQFDTTVVK